MYIQQVGCSTQFQVLARARLMPVLPAVPSVIRPPGCSLPSATASRTIWRATRSLTLPPGLTHSTLAKICNQHQGSLNMGTRWQQTIVTLL